MGKKSLKKLCIRRKKHMMYIKRLKKNAEKYKSLVTQISESDQGAPEAAAETPPEPIEMVVPETFGAAAEEHNERQHELPVEQQQGSTLGQYLQGQCPGDIVRESTVHQYGVSKCESKDNCEEKSKHLKSQDRVTKKTTKPPRKVPVTLTLGQLLKSPTLLPLIQDSKGTSDEKESAGADVDPAPDVDPPPEVDPLTIVKKEEVDEPDTSQTESGLDACPYQLTLHSSPAAEGMETQVQVCATSSADVGAGVSSAAAQYSASQEYVEITEMIPNYERLNACIGNNPATLVFINNTPIVIVHTKDTE